MPTVSDPGYVLVAEAIAQGVAVTAIPGPRRRHGARRRRASDRSLHLRRVPPRKAGSPPRARALAAEPRTMVFFEAPSRLAETLDAMADAFGADRPAAVCRELTKLHEEVVRDGLALSPPGRPRASAARSSSWSGAPAREVSADDALAEVQASWPTAPSEGCRGRGRGATGLSSRDLYQAVLAAR
jgi:16S rRNA (cytidine1402-2'-O)-methyltransferase